MQLQLLRNATLKLRYADRTILVDPDFGHLHSRRSFTGRSANPMVALPLPIEDILAGVDLVIVSHLHADHFDEVAKASLPKDLPVICRPGDEEAIAEAGFRVGHAARLLSSGSARSSSSTIRPSTGPARSSKRWGR